VLAEGDDFKSRAQALTDTGYVGSYPFSGTTMDNYASSTSKFMTEQLHFGVIGKHDVDFILKYLKTLGSTKVLSNPKLAVVNNQEAKIHVGEKQAYITTTTTQTDSGTTVSEAVTFVDVGIQLFVTPTINDDGFVTVKIKPEISSILSFLETSSNNKIPIIDTSTAETIVMVKDGSSIMIGGLSKEDKRVDEEAVPFLGKLPVVGGLFTSKSNKAGRAELVILLTPHIIEGDELVTASGRDFSDALNNKYQGYAPVREETAAVEFKSYQSYPVKGEGDVMPGLKPAHNF
jgi:type II secretory pathway component GspD/PulD (secretin)